MLDIFYAWQDSIASDLNAVSKLIAEVPGDYMPMVRPMVNAAIANERLIVSSLVILTARALDNKAISSETLHAFAAAMELIVVSVQGHAKLSDGHAEILGHPLLALGTASGVLLGDVLYTHAFRMLVSTRHMRGLAEVARATERLVTSATMEHSPVFTGDSSKSFHAVAYGSCCTLAAVLADSQSDGFEEFRKFGLQCGSRERDSDIKIMKFLGENLQPSIYRDGLYQFINQWR